MILQNIKFFIAAVFFSLTLISCGGGGGGGGGSSRRSAPTGVRILHAAIDTSPVDLYSSEVTDSVVQNIRYADEPFYSSLPTGDQTLTLTLRLNPASEFYRGTLTVEKNKHSSVLLYGNNESLGVRAALISDDAGEIPDSQAALRLVHGLVGASGLSVSIDGIEQLSNIGFGSASTYVYLDQGLRTISVRRTADRKVVFSATPELKAGIPYSVFMSGEIDFLVQGKILED